MSTSAEIGVSVDRDGRLSASRCTRCGYVACPPRMAHCDIPMTSLALDPGGRVEAWTRIHVAPKKFSTPYLVGYVRLDDGPRIACVLEPCAADEDAVGRRVRIGSGATGPVAYWLD